MRVHAQAPGKLVLCGEYAVLEGAPAVVAAIARRCRVDVTDSADGAFHVDAPDVHVVDARAQMVAGRLQWLTENANVGRKLNLVTAILEHLCVRGTRSQAVRVQIDTRAFLDANGRKLGLGSSAAVTVALTAAICTHHGYAQPDLPTMLAIHRHIQGGRGSGVDIASSLNGGVIGYRLVDGEPRVAHLAWPAGLAWRAIWSGRSASTGHALAQLDAWRSRYASAYKACMTDLQATATAVERAFVDGDDPGIVDGMATYARLLDVFGRQSGIDIVCAEHRALSRLASECGIVYKPCGAGGGDVGVAVGRDADALEKFCQRSAAAGFRMLDEGIDPHGLRVEACADGARAQDPV